MNYRQHRIDRTLYIYYLSIYNIQTVYIVSVTVVDRMRVSPSVCVCVYDLGTHSNFSLGIEGVHTGY